MTNQVIDKDFVVLLATQTIACVLAIDGRLPWKQHDWSVTTYTFKMTILSLVFTTSTMFIPVWKCKKPGSVDPLLGKTLIVLAATIVTSWILLVDGRVPWDKDNWSLFTYSCKLSIHLLMLMVCLVYVLMGHEKPREAGTAMSLRNSLTKHIRFGVMTATTMAWILRIDGRLPWEEEEVEGSSSVYYCKLSILVTVSIMTAILVSLRRY